MTEQIEEGFAQAALKVEVKMIGAHRTPPMHQAGRGGQAQLVGGVPFINLEWTQARQRRRQSRQGFGHARQAVIAESTQRLEAHAFVKTACNIVVAPHLQDGPISAARTNVIERGAHQLAGNAAAAMGGGHGHVGNGPALAVGVNALHGDVADDLTFFFPYEAVEHVMEILAETAQEHREWPHMTEGAHFAQRAQAAGIKLIGKGVMNQISHAAQITPYVELA